MVKKDVGVFSLEVGSWLLILCFSTSWSIRGCENTFTSTYSQLFIYLLRIEICRPL